jgi:hypothetical protein
LLWGGQIRGAAEQRQANVSASETELSQCTAARAM